MVGWAAIGCVTSASPLIEWRSQGRPRSLPSSIDELRRLVAEQTLVARFADTKSVESLGLVHVGKELL